MPGATGRVPRRCWGALGMAGRVSEPCWGSQDDIGGSPHLQGAPLGGVEDEELLEEVLAIRGHVKWDPVLPPQHPLPQLLQEPKTSRGHPKTSRGHPEATHGTPKPPNAPPKSLVGTLKPPTGPLNTCWGTKPPTGTPKPPTGPPNHPPEDAPKAARVTPKPPTGPQTHPDCGHTLRFCPSKGSEPLTSVYRMTPRLHTSTSGPSYFLPWKSSGAA